MVTCRGAGEEEEEEEEGGGGDEEGLRCAARCAAAVARPSRTHLRALQVGLDGLHDERDLRVRVAQHHGHGHVADELLGVGRARDEADHLHVAEVDVVAHHVDVDELPDVLLLVIATDSLVLELASNLGHLLINNFLLLFFCLAVSDVANIHRKTAHCILLIASHFRDNFIYLL